MSAYVIWLDSHHAKLFKMSPGGATESKMDKSEIKHHTPQDVGNHKDSGKFFEEVVGKLRDASEILLVGPGEARKHFKTHLESHHHAELAKKIVGNEAMDHPHDAQILAHARKFFKVFDLYSDPVR